MAVIEPPAILTNTKLIDIPTHVSSKYKFVFFVIYAKLRVKNPLEELKLKLNTRKEKEMIYKFYGSY
ncbi:10935_t:CDS:2 [Rhizophagus irregularis]|nr:10935_t:CDS:2 [Rhizophagus irregularis]